MGEEIIGRINGLRSIDNMTYNLIFTNSRMIGEYVGGIGAFLAFGAIGQAVATPHLQNKAAQMSENKILGEILSGHKRNFEINNFDIDKIIVKKGLLDSSMLIKFGQRIPKMGKNIQFLFPKKGIEEVESVIMRVFPNKAIIKK